MKYQKLIFVAVVIVIILAIVMLSPKTQFSAGSPTGISLTNKTGTELGSIAPNFALYNVNRTLEKLSDYRGKIVVVNFWASWCPYCLDEMPDFEKLSHVYADTVVVLGINRGEKETIVEDYSHNKVKVSYPILLDSNEDVSNVYVLKGMPVTYFIDQDGNIRNRYFGQITYEIMEQEVKKILQ